MDYAVLTPSFSRSPRLTLARVGRQTGVWTWHWVSSISETRSWDESQHSMS